MSISSKFKTIHELLVKVTGQPTDNYFSRIKASDLVLLFFAYDKVFFKSYLKKAIDKSGYSVKISISSDVSDRYAVMKRAPSSLILIFFARSMLKEDGGTQVQLVKEIIKLFMCHVSLDVYDVKEDEMEYTFKCFYKKFFETDPPTRLLQVMNVNSLRQPSPKRASPPIRQPSPKRASPPRASPPKLALPPHMLRRASPERKVEEKGPVEPPPYGFVWKENSCYIDSLFVILYNFDILSYLIKETDVKAIADKTVNYGNDCEYKGNLNDAQRKDMAIKNAKDIQRSYIDLENSLIKGHKLCIDLRREFLKCRPDMKNGLSWVVYNPAVIYVVLANLFGITFSVPQAIYNFESNTFQMRRPVDQSTITFTDFMIDVTKQKSDEKVAITIVPEEIDSRFLVFENPLLNIKNYDSLEPETIKNLYNGQDQTFYKRRCFGIDILYDRYTLRGVILGTGGSGIDKASKLEGKERITHYVCIVKMEDGNIYYYDDMKEEKRFRGLIGFPEFTFKNRRPSMIPVMYFYQQQAYSMQDQRLYIISRWIDEEKISVFQKTPEYTLGLISQKMDLAEYDVITTSQKLVISAKPGADISRLAANIQFLDEEI